MKKIAKAIKLLTTNRSEFYSSLLFYISFLFPDKLYLKLLFRFKLGYNLNLRNPKTFNEKIQWLKLYNKNPFYTTLVDKYSVKNFVKNKIGEEYVIPTLGLWKNTKSIDFDSLPNAFVLKTTNGGGGDIVICKDKKYFDLENAIKHLNKGLKKNIYRDYREWPYKNVPPYIIAEKYMEDENGELRDYKFFCFNGVVKCIQVDYDRFTEHHRNMYDEKWNKLPFSIMYPSKEGTIIKKPKNLDKMLEIARTLSKDFPHVRVDLYNISGKIYFGELTFFHASGLKKFTPQSWDFTFGDWLKLPIK